MPAATKRVKLFLIGSLAAVCFFWQVGGASASTSVICTSTGYSCASYGYSGNDGPYSYSNFNSSKGHNCTTYIAWILWNSIGYRTEFNLLGNAGEWATNAKKYSALGVSVLNSKSAKQWSVAQWVGGKHVAFVESVSSKNGKTVIVVTEDNYSANVTRKKTITSGDSDWPDYFIDFGIFAPPPGAQFAPLSQFWNEEVISNPEIVSGDSSVVEDRDTTSDG